MKNKNIWTISNVCYIFEIFDRTIVQRYFVKRTAVTHCRVLSDVSMSMGRLRGK